MGYNLEGTILEVCTCNILCPCWVGEDPDGDGKCYPIVAYHFDRGSVDGIDMTGRTLALIADIPRNVLKGDWTVAAYVDDGASDAQQQSLLDVWTGKKGGPVADIAALVGKVVAAERAPITYTISEGRGTIKVGNVAEAEMEPYRGPTGQVTTLNESVFSTIPGSPAWVAKASKYTRNVSHHGLKDLDIQGHNAIQGTFRFESN